MASKQTYSHISQRQHILLRPNMYIKSAKCSPEQVWLVQGDSIVQKEVNYNPGLIHIFYEILSNAVDNYFRSIEGEHPLRKIEVTIDQETGRVTVWNDGNWIPNRVHQWQPGEEKIGGDIYEAELIFGHLNSSSNYDENQKSISGGTYGLGAKLTNIFSKEFTIETFDPDTGIKYEQTFRDNLEKRGEPKIKTLKQKKGWTQISYIADFQRFSMKGYDEDHLAVMKKLCIDAAMNTGKQVVFNGEPIPTKDLSSYVDFYQVGTDRVEFKGDDCSVVFAEKATYEPGLTHVAFVNGINTNRGGAHVEQVRKLVIKPLFEKLKVQYTKGKDANFKITAKSLEAYFTTFIRFNTQKPEFENQTKGYLMSPAPNFTVPATKISAMLKWKFIGDVEESLQLNNLKELNKISGKKTQNIDIPNADDAIWAGSAKSAECTLFVTEGLSAKTFVVKGISALEDGRKRYGILPVRGKVLNVRGASMTQISNNAEITNLIKMLGLQHNVDYTKPENFKTLRYGKVRILTDADHDGAHIKGLLINFIHYFYPSLIKCGYVASLRTPIVKTSIGKQHWVFYYLKDFREWAKRQKSVFKAEYYKGLGTSTDEDIRDVFREPRYIQYQQDPSTDERVELVFADKRSNDRKVWLENYTEREFKYEQSSGQEIVPISNFFDNEMIEFSIYDNQRSIPSIVDGMKPSQRKALHVGLRVLSTTEKYKVKQFAGEVAKRAAYHHGETSMEGTIVNMAQTFVGSNNIAVFSEQGQFGSRLQMGRDAADARYIFTQLPKITRTIYRKEDDPILEYLEDEGQMIEPKYFVPILPMLLVNGCQGIGTGYSCNIPAFNPLDLVHWIKEWLRDRNAVSADSLKPWYDWFKGEIEPDDKNTKKFLFKGQLSKEDQNVYRITELPVGVATDDYKAFLDKLRTGVAKTAEKTGYEAMTTAQLKEELALRKLPQTGVKKVLVEKLKAHDRENGTSMKKSGTSGQLISKYEDYSDAYNVDIKVWSRGGELDESALKLVEAVSLTNMTAFTPVGGLKKYADLSEVLQTFCAVRFDFYVRRKRWTIEALEADLACARSKARFIKAVLEDASLLRKTEEELFAQFDTEKYWKRENSYRYLTDMPIRTFTRDKYEALQREIKEIEQEIDYVKRRTPEEMWIHELDEFVKTYKEWREEIIQKRQSLQHKSAGEKKKKVKL